jgi:alkylated DNA repair dioxygenase AlkB
MSEPLIYVPNFYTTEKTQALFDVCAKLPFKQRLSVWNKPIRHQTVGFTVLPSQRLQMIGAECPMDTAPNEIKELCSDLSIYSGNDINYASVVRYRDGDDYIAWHRHKEDQGRDASVYIVTTGAERPFAYKPIGGKATKFIAEQGSLIILSSEANETHLHSVPKCGDCHAVRYSVNCKSIAVPRIVHVNDGDFDLYIGREFFDRGTGKKYEESIWANKHKFDLAGYEIYVRHTDRWYHLEDLRGKVLGCWCRGERFPHCHGTVLLKLLDEIDAGTPRASVPRAA